MGKNRSANMSRRICMSGPLDGEVVEIFGDSLVRQIDKEHAIWCAYKADGYKLVHLGSGTHEHCQHLIGETGATYTHVETEASLKTVERVLWVLDRLDGVPAFLGDAGKAAGAVVMSAAFFICAAMAINLSSGQWPSGRVWAGIFAGLLFGKVFREIRQERRKREGNDGSQRPDRQVR